jgi:hypothetical protein
VDGTLGVIITIALAGIIAVVVVIAKVMSPSVAPSWVCATCGSLSEGARRTPGSFLLEIALWGAGLWYIGDRYVTQLRLPPALQSLYDTQAWLLLIPLAYSVYRIAARKRRCAACGGGQLVPADSPVGQRIRADNRRDPPRDVK